MPRSNARQRRRPPLVLVEAKTAPPALAAATLGGLAGPYRHHDRVGILIEGHPLDDRPLDTKQPGP